MAEPGKGRNPVWFRTSMEGLGERKPSPGDVGVALQEGFTLLWPSLLGKGAGPRLPRLLYLMANIKVYILLGLNAL